MEEELPRGYRFYPTEEELVSFYLLNKLNGKREEHTRRVIPVLDIYTKEPWDLPKFSGELCNGDREQWFFFTPRQEREAQGGRPNRTTASGYWKATGSPGFVYSLDNKAIAVKKTMVFYKGKAPAGRKTKWKMNEYRAIDHESNSTTTTTITTTTTTTTTTSTTFPKLRHEFRLCRVYVVSGSSRAFDRRPLQEGGGEAQKAGKIVEKASSSDETCSHSGELADFPETSAGIHSNSGNWEINEGCFDEQPLWEWEELNLLY